MKITNPTENLAAAVSFRLTDGEYRVLALRANRARRTVSQLVRLLIMTIHHGEDMEEKSR